MLRIITCQIILKTNAEYLDEPSLMDIVFTFCYNTTALKPHVHGILKNSAFAGRDSSTPVEKNYIFIRSLTPPLQAGTALAGGVHEHL